MARTLAEPIRITGKEAAEVFGLSVRQIKRIVKRFREDGINSLKKKSTRPNSSPNRITKDVEKVIVEARKETGFGADKIAIIVTQALKIEDRKPVSDTTCYNVLARNGLVEAEKRIQTQYKNFEMSRPDELIQADITTFKGVPMEGDCSRMDGVGNNHDS